MDNIKTRTRYGVADKEGNLAYPGMLGTSISFFRHDGLDPDCMWEDKDERDSFFDRIKEEIRKESDLSKVKITIVMEKEL